MFKLYKQIDEKLDNIERLTKANSIMLEQLDIRLRESRKVMDDLSEAIKSLGKNHIQWLRDGDRDTIY